MLGRSWLVPKGLLTLTGQVCSFWKVSWPTVAGHTCKPTWAVGLSWACPSLFQRHSAHFQIQRLELQSLQSSSTLCLSSVYSCSGLFSGTIAVSGLSLCVSLIGQKPLLLHWGVDQPVSLLSTGDLPLHWNCQCLTGKHGACPFVIVLRFVLFPLLFCFRLGSWASASSTRSGHGRSRLRCSTRLPPVPCNGSTVYTGLSGPLLPLITWIVSSQ